MPFRGNIFLLINGLDRAFINAQRTINAGIWINVKLIALAEVCFVLGRVNAVNRADLYAGGVLGTDARLCDHVGHVTEFYAGLAPYACPA